MSLNKHSKTKVLKALSDNWSNDRIEEMCRRAYAYLAVERDDLFTLIRRIVSETDKNRERIYAVPLLKARPTGVIELNVGARKTVKLEMYVLFNALFRFEREWDSFAVFHHHGDGIKLPSRQDRELTERIEACCKALRVQFRGHFVSGSDGIEKVIAKEKKCSHSDTK